MRQPVDNSNSVTYTEQEEYSTISPNGVKIKTTKTWTEKLKKQKKLFKGSSWSWKEYLILAGGIVIGLICPPLIIALAVAWYLDEISNE